MSNLFLFLLMIDFINGINPRFVCVDPSPVPTASVLKVSMTALGIVFAPCGLPGKVLGGVAGYAVGSKVAKKVFKQQ